jgi:hypothetical protein
MIPRTTPNHSLIRTLIHIPIHIPIHSLMKDQVMAALYDEAYEAGTALERAMTRTALEHAMTRAALEQSMTCAALIRRRPA